MRGRPVPPGDEHPPGGRHPVRQVPRRLVRERGRRRGPHGTFRRLRHRGRRRPLRPVHPFRADPAGRGCPARRGEPGVQHPRQGFGEKLLKEAENIAMDNGKEEVAIISGIGSRNYYRKFGYERVGPYMIRKL